MVEVEHSRYVEHAQTEGDTILAALDANPTAVVPSCPGWTTRDLAAHCANIWAFFGQVVSNPSIDPPTGDSPVPPTDPEELSSWGSARLAELCAALATLDGTQRMWTFAGVRPAAFYPRRMAQENTIHRWDAERAVSGSPRPIDADLAADGLDEFLTVLSVRSLERMEPGEHPVGTFHLHRTDGDGEWMAEVVDGALVLSKEHGKGDVAVRGSASDLYLFLRGRGAGESIEIFGDESVATAWSKIGG